MREVSPSLLFVLHTEKIVKTHMGTLGLLILVITLLAFLCTRSKLAVQQLRAGAMTSSISLKLLMLELHSLEEKT